MREDDLGMGDGNFSGAGGDGDGGSTECLEDGCAIKAPHAMALEELGDGGDAQTPGPGGRRGQFPDFAHTGAGEVGIDLEELRKAAPELLSEHLNVSEIRSGAATVGNSVWQRRGGMPWTPKRA